MSKEMKRIVIGIMVLVLLTIGVSLAMCGKTDSDDKGKKTNSSQADKEIDTDKGESAEEKKTEDEKADNVKQDSVSNSQSPASDKNSTDYNDVISGDNQGSDDVNNSDNNTGDSDENGDTLIPDETEDDTDNNWSPLF